MKLCVVSIKHTWPGEGGVWLTDGGFSYQMSAIGSLFDEISMVLVRIAPRGGAIRLPARARIVPLPEPAGVDFRRKLSVLARLPHLLWIIAREIRRADVVHTPLPGDVGFLGLLLAQAMRKPVVARYCGSWVTNSQTTIANRLMRWWMRRTAGGRNVMLATGELDTPPAPGMHWVFATAVSAGELSSIQPDLQRGLSVPPRLVFIGRLETGKGLPMLLDALALLRSRGTAPMPSLKILGDGSERPMLEARARELALPVTFTGQLDRTALSTHLIDADLCVQPSLSEGFSKAWLDSMAHGVPVLASNVGAASSVIGAAGERGWLMQDPSAEHLAALIAEALGTGDWPAMRKRCRAYAEAHTLEAWGERIGRLCADQWGMQLVEGRLR